MNVSRRILAGATAAALSGFAVLGSPIVHAQAPTATEGRPVAAPWPSAEQLRARRVAAEGRALFTNEAPLAITLTSDFKAVQRDRNPESTKLFPAPLRVEFDPQTTAGTVFEGHRALKLGTHCREADLFEQYMPREYVAYRILNLLTPRSFRARLVDASYINAPDGKKLAERQGLFI